MTLGRSRLPAAEYMALPASQYSVLDAKRIERIDDATFRCYVGGLKLFNFSIDPVLTVSVTVTERGPTVKLLSTKVSIVANARFSSLSGRKCSKSRRHYSFLRCHMFLQLDGSPAVVAANDKFTATMTNDVRWSSGPAPDLLELGSDTSIQVCWRIGLPSWPSCAV